MPNIPRFVSLDQAVASIPDGAYLGIGGWIFNGQPVALARALARRGAQGLKLLPSPGSIAPDLLIGAGCAAETACVFLSFEQFGLAPQFRRAAESGRLAVRELDGPAFAGGLRAAACDLAEMMIPDLGTDLPRANPANYRAVPRKAGERPLIAVPALRPDIVILHAQAADDLGNIQFRGAPFFDVLLAQAAGRVIVSVDRLVSRAALKAENHLTKLPYAFVDMVVHVPDGARPTASAGLYSADEAALAAYVRACADDASFRAWLEDDR